MYVLRRVILSAVSRLGALDMTSNVKVFALPAVVSVVSFNLSDASTN